MDTTGPIADWQLRLLHGKFAALGYQGTEHRELRLAAAAGALGLEHLASFKDLTSGQVGQILSLIHTGEVPEASGWPAEGFVLNLAESPAKVPDEVLERIAAAVRVALIACVVAVWFLTADRPTRIAIAVLACAGISE